ncbi:MAG: hypothetical protein ACQKBU_09795, partial [Verrucomicrobiales bacterium]
MPSIPSGSPGGKLAFSRPWKVLDSPSSQPLHCRRQLVLAALLALAHLVNPWLFCRAPNRSRLNTAEKSDGSHEIEVARRKDSTWTGNAEDGSARANAARRLT